MSVVVQSIYKPIQYFGFPETSNDVPECWESDDHFSQMESKEEWVNKCTYKCQCSIGQIVEYFNVQEYFGNAIAYSK